MSRDTAAALKGISLDAQRIGGSPEDVAVLGFAAEQSGTDRDELITQISTLSSEFLTLRENIASADKTYRRFLDRKAADLTLARDAGDGAAFWNTYNGMKDDISGERMKSISAIDARLAQIEAETNRIESRSDFGLHTRADVLVNRVKDQKLAQEIYDLQDARKQLVASQSPQGQAFFELQPFGLDQEAASKGGIGALLAISDAFKRVQDESKKARIAAKLFGEDAGPKLIPLLNGGREAINRYRETLEASGVIATKADIEASNQYTLSIQRLKLAWEGVKLTVSRTLWPDMTKSADQLTAFLIKSRTQIAKYMTDIYRASEQLVKDAFSILSGNTNEIKTKWLDTLVQRTLALRDVWDDVRKQIGLLWEGKDTDYAWLNMLRDGMVAVRDFSKDAFKQVMHLIRGEDTDYEWLNTLRDGVEWFAEHLVAAFGLFKSTLNGIKEVVSPILSFFGTDFATTALFVSMLRFSGLLGGIRFAIEKIGGGLGKLRGAAPVIEGEAAAPIVATPATRAAAHAEREARIKAERQAIEDAKPENVAARAAAEAAAEAEAKAKLEAEKEAARVAKEAAKKEREDEREAKKKEREDAKKARAEERAAKKAARDAAKAERDAEMQTAADVADIENETAKTKKRVSKEIKDTAIETAKIEADVLTDREARLAEARNRMPEELAVASESKPAVPEIAGRTAAVPADVTKPKPVKIPIQVIDTGATQIQIREIATQQTVAQAAIRTVAAEAEQATSALGRSTVDVGAKMKDVQRTGTGTFSSIRSSISASARSMKDELVMGTKMYRDQLVEAGKGTLSIGSKITSVGGSFKAATTGMISNLLSVGLSVGSLVDGLLILGTTAKIAFEAGQMFAEWFYENTQKAYDNLIEKQAEVIRANDEVYMNKMLRDRKPSKEGVIANYWQSQDVNVMTAEQRQKAGYEAKNEALGLKNWYKTKAEQDEMGTLNMPDRQPAPYKTVAVTLDVAGRKTTLMGDEVSSSKLVRDLEVATRGY